MQGPCVCSAAATGRSPCRSRGGLGEEGFMCSRVAARHRGGPEIGRLSRSACGATTATFSIWQVDAGPGNGT